MIKSITHCLIIFSKFQQLKSQISQIDQNGYKFCDEILHLSYHISLFKKNTSFTDTTCTDKLDKD